jgi:5'-nucleotidase
LTRSEQAFFRHVSDVSSGLVRSRHLAGIDHAGLIVAARRCELGRQLQVELIAFNDFHGNIKSFEGSSSNPGVARLAIRIKEPNDANPIHVVVPSAT